MRGWKGGRAVMQCRLGTHADKFRVAESTARCPRSYSHTQVWGGEGEEAVYIGREHQKKVLLLSKAQVHSCLVEVLGVSGVELFQAKLLDE